ncbi:MAG: AAA family ATPase [Bacteroidia bacterium]
MNIKDRISALLKSLNQGLYEKEQAMGLALLSAIAGESIFLLGAPGVAKSLIARRLKYAFKDGKSFEYLMNRFSTPDEIFGPVSISGLKVDKYERKTDHYLPWATVVFLDEIWKAGPSIQNALLTVLNERVYRNGAQEVEVNMKALISASNELPAQGEGLEALWDRFLVRLVVEGIQDKAQFNEMITVTGDPYKDTIAEDQKISEKDYLEWSKAIDEIKVPKNVLQVIQILRAAFQAHSNKHKDKANQIYVSDRRWRKIVRLLRTSAFLNDRTEVDLMDCFLIGHCVWDSEVMLDICNREVKGAIQRHGYKLSLDLNELREELKEIDADVLEETSFLKPIQKERLRVFEGKYYLVDGYSGAALIEILEFDSLSPTSESTIKFYSNNGGHYRHESSRKCRKGNKKNSIVIKAGNYYHDTGTQYDILVESYQEQIKATRKPHSSTKKHFDEQIAKCKKYVQDLFQEISIFRSKDLKHLRVNVFVTPELAEIVESNLNASEKEIRQLDIEADRIKRYYETVEDQSK